MYFWWSSRFLMIFFQQDMLTSTKCLKTPWHLKTRAFPTTCTPWDTSIELQFLVQDQTSNASIEPTWSLEVSWKNYHQFDNKTNKLFISAQPLSTSVHQHDRLPLLRRTCHRRGWLCPDALPTKPVPSRRLQDPKRAHQVYPPWHLSLEAPWWTSG